MYPVVFPVGHIHRPLPVHADAPRLVKLAGAAAIAAPSGDKLPLFSEPLHPVIAAVHHIKAVVRGKGQAGRAVQLPQIAARNAPLLHKLALAVHNGDAMQVFVGHIKIAGRVQSQGSRPDKLAVAGSIAADVADEFVVQPALADAEGQFIDPPVQHIQGIPGAQGEILRHQKADAGSGIHSHTVAEVIHSPGGDSGQHQAISFGRLRKPAGFFVLQQVQDERKTRPGNPLTDGIGPG